MLSGLPSNVGLLLTRIHEYQHFVILTLPLPTMICPHHLHQRSCLHILMLV